MRLDTADFEQGHSSPNSVSGDTFLMYGSVLHIDLSRSGCLDTALRRSRPSHHTLATIQTIKSELRSNSLYSLQ
jgi:hypothetical protein